MRRLVAVAVLALMVGTSACQGSDGDDTDKLRSRVADLESKLDDMEASLDRAARQLAEINEAERQSGFERRAAERAAAEALDLADDALVVAYDACNAVGC